MLEGKTRSGKRFRANVILALNYAINHTQNDFEKIIFSGLKDTINRELQTFLCEVTVLKAIFKFGIVFTRFESESAEFAQMLIGLESTTETLIHI